MKDPVEAAVKRGQALVDMGRFDAATAAFREAIALDPADVWPRAWLAYALSRLSRITEALHAAEEAIALDPEYPWAVQLRSSFLFKLGRYEEAIDAAREAIDLDPSLSVCVANLAYYLVLAGQASEATKPAARAVELDPNLPHAWEIRGLVALAQRRWAQAERYLRRAIELAPPYSDALTRLGWVVLKLRRVDEAEELFRSALRLDPEQTQAARSLGYVLRLRGRSEEAAELDRAADATWLHLMERQIEADPENPAAHAIRIEILRSLHRRDEAVAAAEQAVQLVHRPPDAARCWASLAYAQYEAGAVDDARDSLGHAQRLDPNGVWPLYERAYFSFLLKDAADGQRAAQKLANRYPTRYETAAALGYASLAASKWADAAAAFDEAGKRHGDLSCCDLSGRAIAEIMQGRGRRAHRTAQEVELLVPNCGCALRTRLDEALDRPPPL